MKIDAETQNLIVSAKLGDAKAATLLFARYQQRILHIVRLRLKPGLRQRLKLQSMDIVQEVFMYAFQRLKDFEPQSQGHFLHWLSKKVEHCICDRLDYVATLKRYAPGGEVSYDEEIEGYNKTEGLQMQIEGDNTTPTQFAARQNRREMIDSLLALLDEEARELIVQRDLEEMTFAEIAQQTGEKPETVRKRYNRTLHKLINMAEEKLKTVMAEDSFREYKNDI